MIGREGTRATSGLGLWKGHGASPRQVSKSGDTWAFREVIGARPSFKEQPRASITTSAKHTGLRRVRTNRPAVVACTTICSHAERIVGARLSWGASVVDNEELILRAARPDSRCCHVRPLLPPNPAARALFRGVVVRFHPSSTSSWSEPGHARHLYKRSKRLD